MVMMSLDEMNLVRVGMSAVSKNDFGFELMWLSQVGCGFQVVAAKFELKLFPRAIRTKRFERDPCVCGRIHRLRSAVKEIKPEARRHAGFKDADFQKAVPEIEHHS